MSEPKATTAERASKANEPDGLRFPEDFFDFDIYPEGHPLAADDEDTAVRLMTSRLDISCLIEGNRTVPVLFGTLAELELWAKYEGLVVDRIFKRSRNAVRISGWILVFSRGRAARSYVDMVWVQNRWRRYRHGLNKRALDSSEPALAAGLHADHIVARTRLANLPAAWVLLIEVPRHANTGFGSRIERHLVPLPGNIRRYNLGGIEMFKIFCEAMPGPSTGSLEEAFERVRRQFICTNRNAATMLREMEKDVRAVYDRALVSAPGGYGAELRPEAFSSYRTG